MKKAKTIYYLLSFLIALVGIGGLFTYDFVLRPHVFSKSVVAVKYEKELLPKGYVLTKDDVYVKSVDTEDVPKGYYVSVSEVVGKTLGTDVSGGVILVSSFLNDGFFSLAEGESVFPIPKDVIFAVNGSLRSGDSVDIYAVPSEEDIRYNKSVLAARATGQDGAYQSVPTVSDAESSAEGQDVEAEIDSVLQSESYGTEEVDLVSVTEKVVEKVTVVYVRSDDNNDVKDTEEGNVNRRTTSTANVSNLEVKLNEEAAKAIAKHLDKGRKLWIVRVN